MNQAQSLSNYTPDFSDLCSDKQTFWDFLSKEADSTGCETNIPFYDCLNYDFSSKIENRLNKKLYDHSKTDKVQNNFDIKDSSRHTGIRNGDTPVGVLNSNTDHVLKNSDDEFWDFLDSKEKNNTENKLPKHCNSMKTPHGILNSETDEVASEYDFWEFLDSKERNNTENKLKYSSKTKFYLTPLSYDQTNISSVVALNEQQKLPKLCNSIKTPNRILTSETDGVTSEYDFWDFLESKERNNISNKLEYRSNTKFYSTALSYDSTNVSNAATLSELQKLPKRCNVLEPSYEILNSEVGKVASEDDFWDFLKTENSSEYIQESLCGLNTCKTQNTIEEIKELTSAIDISITPTSNQFDTQIQSRDIEKSKSFSCEKACISKLNKLVKTTPVSHNSGNIENCQTLYSSNVDSLFKLDSLIDQENNYSKDQQNCVTIDTNNSDKKISVMHTSALCTTASNDYINSLEAKNEQTAETGQTASTVCSRGKKHITPSDANQTQVFSQNSKEQITWTKDTLQIQKLNPKENNFRVQSNFSEREMQLTEVTVSKNTCSNSQGISSCTYNTVKSPNIINTIKYEFESRNNEETSLVSEQIQHEIEKFDSESMQKLNENSEMNLPIISSVFSISNCLDDLNTAEFSFNSVNVSQSNGYVKNAIKLSSTEIDTLNVNEKNLLVADKLSSVNSNVILQKKSDVNLEQSLKTNLNGTPPNRKPNMKRQIQSSPQNSVFRITDSDPVANVRMKLENEIFNEAVDSKRLKTNDTEIKRDETSQGQHDFISLNVPLIPIKTVHIPSSELEANNITVPNSNPIYLIIPNNIESGDSQNAELLLVVNNKNANNNLTLNNSVKQGGYNISAFPVTRAAKISNTYNTLNSKARISSAEHKLLPLSKNFTLRNQSINNSNYLQQAQVAEPFLQKSINEVKQSEILYQVNADKPPITSLDQAQNSVEHFNLGKESETKSFQGINPVPFSADFSGFFSNSLKYADSKTSQCNKSTKYKKVKPIKSVSIGKDKNAIQQTSIPIKMENITDQKVFGHSLGISNSIEKATSNFTRTDLKTIPLSMCDSTKWHQSILKRDSTNTDLATDKNKLKNSKILIKPNLIINNTESVNKNDLFRPLNNSGVASLYERKFSVLGNHSKESTIVGVSNPDPSTLNVSISKLRAPVIGKNETDKSETRQVVKLVSASQTDLPGTSSSHKNSLDTLKKIFPPPITVSVVQTTQVANKPAISKEKGANTNNRTQISILDTVNKISAKRVNYKPKKMGRKTVRELLQEKYQQGAEKAYCMEDGTKALRSVFKLTTNNIVMPFATQMPVQKFPDVTENIASVPLDLNMDKRPNIMVLPSATKIVTANVLPQTNNRKNLERKYSFQASKDPERVFEKPPDILSPNSLKISKEAISKDSHKSKYYDMSVLLVGYIKVEDEVDSRGRFRSKFKVLFSKRQFVYDFPVTKCNQVDGSNIETWNQMARILVPFNSIEAIEMINRRINIKVNRYPSVFLWEMRRKSGLMMHSAKGFTEPSGNSIWLDAVQNSLFHKITLRSRQADTLKVQLCQFDAEFFSLFNNALTCGITVVDANPFEEDLASSNLRKLYRKSKNNCVRRLPWWDSEMPSESLLSRRGDDLLLSPMQVCCSCRISCRSLRCSCVKAAKMCSTEVSKCLCTACDNPLNILSSFELSLDFCLGDSCLFQNIYQIKSLRSFLLRDVKLVCCNTVTRVLDCIPGIILCPNTDCNASVEFSWCRAIVCYPERNPRNHCSLCGRCCFSNGRHCPVCNRCYSVSPKCPECPNCLGIEVSTNHDVAFENEFFPVSLPPVEEMKIKCSSKPEIIVLDSSTQR